MKLKSIVKEAKQVGLCQQWYKDFLRDHSLKTLCQKYFEGLDWAMEKDFPSIDVLRHYVGLSDTYGIHTDFIGEITNEYNVLQRHGFFGASSASFKAGDFSVSEIVVRHDSKLKINAVGNAYLIVNVLDNASVHIECQDNASVDVYRYSDRAQVLENGNVKIKNRW